jgi:predicted transcriptional regulator
MLPDIQLIKTKRQRLGIKQKELAELSRVSQSLIAKLESGKIEPSYSIVNRIFSALESKEHKSEKTCYDLMTKKIISIKSKDKAIKAKEMIKKHDISQIPVFEGKRCVGSITESLLLEHLDENLSKLKVNEIMGPSFPIINSSTPISLVIPLLKSSDALLISHNSLIAGILTKSDVL